MREAINSVTFGRETRRLSLWEDLGWPPFNTTETLPCNGKQRRFCSKVRACVIVRGLCVHLVSEFPRIALSALDNIRLGLGSPRLLAGGS